MSYEPPRYIVAKFPVLTAALTEIAGLDEGSELNAARERAVDAYGNELLPAILGGEWTYGPSCRGRTQSRWNCPRTRFGSNVTKPAASAGKIAQSSATHPNRPLMMAE